HRGDHGRAQEPLQRPEQDHALDVPGEAAEHAGEGEARGGDGEQPARREHPREPARQRDHHDLRDQIGGLHPADLVLGRGEAAADVLERGGGDLGVQPRHQHPHAHYHEGQQAAYPARGGGRAGHGALSGADRVSTLTVVDRPGRSAWSIASPGSSSMRTGTRCTILVKFPVAFSGGMTLKTAPVPGATLTTWPWKTWPGSASAVTVADCPDSIRASWSSLKLASTQSPSAGVTEMR